jgi:predicted nuclease of predicted toxin-antitoxin system
VNISYQADADLNQAIVTGVLRQEPTIDFQTALAGGLEGVKDSEVLAIAAQQGRILVSHDRKTMPSEFAEFITSNQSAGVIIVSQKVPVEVAIEELVMIWAISSAEEWSDRIAKLPL